MGYHFINAVWGERFVDVLLKLVLPTQLTPGNLGHFRDKPGCRYRIFTTERDAHRMRAAPIFAKLEAIMPVDLVVVPGLGERSGHNAAYADMTACHRQAIVDAERDGVAMLFLAGDTMLSEGSFRHLAVLCEAGYAAVLVAGIRLVAETAVDALIARFYDPATMEAKAEARELMAQSLPHLHPLITSCFLDSDQFIAFPSNLIVPVEGRGLLLRSFHYHPVLIKPMVNGVGVEHTVDFDYLQNACPDPSLIHLVEDSDEVLMVSVDREAHRSDLLKPNKFNLTRLAAFARQHAYAYQQSMCLDRVCRFHADEPGPEWARAERKVKLLGERLRFALAA